LVARPVVELNYKDMGALPFFDNSLWPLVVYYARGLNLDYADDGGLRGLIFGMPSPGPSPRGGEKKIGWILLLWSQPFDRLRAGFSPAAGSKGRGASFHGAI
jgi:hypothetical protein